MKTPERLMNDQYLVRSVPFQIFKQSLTQPIDTHWHEFFELALIVAGSGTHVVNGRTERIERGSMFMLTPADFHSIEPDQGQTIELFDLIFQEQFIQYEILERLFAYGALPSPLFPEAIFADLQRLAERTWGEMQEEQPLKFVVIRNSLELLIIDLIRACQAPLLDSKDAANQPKFERPSFPAIRKALVYLQHHFREPLTLAQTAKHVGLSPHYFSECFHQLTGISFQSYLIQLRLEFARSLLLTVHHTITEIAHASGFQTVTHFERIFKNRFGVSPSRLRKNQN